MIDGFKKDNQQLFEQFQYLQYFLLGRFGVYYDLESITKETLENERNHINEKSELAHVIRKSLISKYFQYSQKCSKIKIEMNKWNSSTFSQLSKILSKRKKNKPAFNDYEAKYIFNYLIQDELNPFLKELYFRIYNYSYFNAWNFSKEESIRLIEDTIDKFFTELVKNVKKAIKI